MNHVDQIRHTCLTVFRNNEPTPWHQCVDIGTKCRSPSCVSHLIFVCVCLFLSVLVAGHPLPTKHPVSPGLIPRFPRSEGPAGIAGSSLSAMELFQGLPSADTILFATLTSRPKTQTSEEASGADDLLNRTSNVLVRNHVHTTPLVSEC